MPRTINEGFDDFHSKLTASGSETTSAANHRDSIERCLKNNFELKRFFRTGSFGNGTSIRTYSDVDYFAVIPPQNLWNSSKYSLTQIRNQLNTTFHSTNVRVDDPAIVCPFGSDARETHEIVPCYFVKDENGFPIYNISDTGDNWMKASPELHNYYIKSENERLNGKLKPLIRFVKAWKYYKSVNISSFYLELRIAKLMEKETTIVYLIDLSNVLTWLEENELPSIQDPMGISGLVSPCKTTIQKADSISKLSTAASRARKAKELETKGEIKDAFYYLNLLFDDKFPSYYL